MAKTRRSVNGTVATSTDGNVVVPVQDRRRSGSGVPAEPPTSADLDRRRNLAVAARGRAEVARIEADQRQAALDVHDTRRRNQETAIAEAKRQAKRLARQAKEHEATLRKLADERQRLAKDVKRSRKAAEAADGKARRAEAKYDDAVLHGMVQREKRVDLELNAPKR